jgi:hypothetical protein
MRILLILISFSLLIGLSLKEVSIFFGSNIWVFHLITLIEYVMLSYMFSFWQRVPAIRRTILGSIPVFALIWLFAKLSIENFSHLDNYTMVLSSVLLTGISSYTLLSLLGEETIPALSRTPQFWVATGVLIYYAGNLFMFALPESLNYWFIHNLISSLSNLLYLGGFLCLLPR